MEAVKMPNITQVKSQVRTASADAPKGGDEFKKLLQVKKDQVQKDQVQKDQVQNDQVQKDQVQPGAKKADDESGKKDVEDASKDKKDDYQDPGQGKASLEDAAEQDALLQAAMQQTAAQMAGIVTDVQEQVTVQTAKPVEAEDEGVAPTEEISVKEAAQPKAETERTVEAAGRVEQKEESDVPADNGQGQKAESDFKAPASGKVPGRETEVQDYRSQTEVKPQEKVQTEVKPQEKAESHENLYGAPAAKSEAEQGFGVPKTEQVPLKTSQDTLPQDLGRTIADRFSGAGRELVVELEPANLGKLTIKMVYEAGRAAVSIIATNPKTLEILNQKAAEIANILEEKTGQETIIYTQEAQQESQEENPDGGNQGGQGERQGQREGHQEREDRHGDMESFAQQLRLGLV